MKHFILVLSCIVLLLSSCSTPNIVSGNVILVRHADRDDGMENLNKSGEQRAEDLADLLREANIKAVFSSDYARTRETAAPICKALKIQPTIYDSSDIPALISKIKKEYAGELVLVIGHSNTVPETVNAFEIEPPLTTINHHEYSNLYILKYGAKNEVLLLKYGATTHK